MNLLINLIYKILFFLISYQEKFQLVRYKLSRISKGVGSFDLMNFRVRDIQKYKKILLVIFFFFLAIFLVFRLKLVLDMAFNLPETCFSEKFAI